MEKDPNSGLAGVQICSESCVALGKLLALSEPQVSHQRRVFRSPEHWYRIAGASGSPGEEQPYGACGGYPPRNFPFSFLVVFSAAFNFF